MESSTAQHDSHLSQTGSGLAFAVGFYFSFRIVIVFFCVRVLGMEARTGSMVHLTLELLLLLAVGLQFVGNASRTFASVARLASVRWALAFLIFSGCSFAWTASVSPPASLIYWGAMVTDVALVVLLLRQGDSSIVPQSLLKGFVWSSCFLAVIAWIVPAAADFRLGDEEFFNTNQIANACAFGIFFAQYLLRRKDGNWRFAIGLLAITLLRSLSKATLLAFVVSEGFILFRDRAISRRTKLLLSLATVLVLAAFWGPLQSYMDLYTSSGTSAETLTGRTTIWAYVLNEALQQPWIGHGFDSMWKVLPPFNGDFEARHAENELLQQFYAYGVAGIVLLMGAYISLYRQIRKMAARSVQLTFTGLLLFIVVRGLAEAEPLDLLLPLWAVVLIALLAESSAAATETLPEAASISPLKPQGYLEAVSPSQ